MDRLLSIGINTYPDAPLRGCVHDTIETCKNLVDGWGYESPFSRNSIRACTDDRARAVGLYNRLEEFTNDVNPGDRLLFHYSGHGAQIPSRNGFEIDGLQEVLCPVDFDFDKSSTWITDVVFMDVFSRIPGGANCTVILDTCHSGGMVSQRNIVDPRRLRTFDGSIDFKVRFDAAKEREVTKRPLIRAADCPNVVFILGCREDQFCSEAILDHEYRGAFTKYLWEAIANMPYGSLDDVVFATRELLRKNQFWQEPVIIGSPLLRAKPFMWRP